MTFDNCEDQPKPDSERSPVPNAALICDHFLYRGTPSARRA
jgi:hypothetical protein